MTESADETDDRVVGGSSPLDALGVIASQDVMITPMLRHAEFFTMRGLLTILWHEPDQATDAVTAGVPSVPAAIVACGGAMGGLLGPAEGLYQRLGETWAARGVPVLRVDFRRPNDMDSCCIDVAAAVQLAVVGGGAERVVVMGHSFGGAVAVRVGVGLSEMVAGVVTFATQSAGCEIAAGLAGRPFLLFHGDRDEILPLQSSQLVRAIAGTGELVVCQGDGHLLAHSGPQMMGRLDTWLTEVFAS
jgi:predicted alpha/beta hydrolase family esterase